MIRLFGTSRNLAKQAITASFACPSVAGYRPATLSGHDKNARGEKKLKAISARRKGDEPLRTGTSGETEMLVYSNEWTRRRTKERVFKDRAGLNGEIHSRVAELGNLLSVRKARADTRTSKPMYRPRKHGMGRGSLRERRR